jgi:hypothetical protein
MNNQAFINLSEQQASLFGITQNFWSTQFKKMQQFNLDCAQRASANGQQIMGELMKAKDISSLSSLSSSVAKNLQPEVAQMSKESLSLLASSIREVSDLLDQHKEMNQGSYQQMLSYLENLPSGYPSQMAVSFSQLVKGYVSGDAYVREALKKMMDQVAIALERFEPAQSEAVQKTTSARSK